MAVPNSLPAGDEVEQPLVAVVGDDAAQQPVETVVEKKKVAMFVGYLGAGYFVSKGQPGSQLQPLLLMLDPVRRMGARYTLPYMHTCTHICPQPCAVTPCCCCMLLLQGFQRQRDHPSVEAALEAACHRAGGISPEQAGTFTQVRGSKGAGVREAGGQEGRGQGGREAGGRAAGSRKTGGRA